MRTTTKTLAALALGLMGATSLMAAAAQAADIRIEWYSDGVEGQVMQDLIDRFNKEHTDIHVTLDQVSYQTIQEQLPVQLAAGQGPDIARVTNLKTQADYWLDLTPYIKDADFWRKNYGDQLDWMRPDGSDAIPGFMTQITLTGGFINKTLFEQAGVDVPAENATWDDWIAAAQEVAKSQQLPYAFAIDRSGHRITGPAISYGAQFIGKDGKPVPLDQASKDYMTKLVGWTTDGTGDKDVWVSASGTTYRAGADDFINAQTPYYYSGSWQIPNFATKIGSNFDWVATGSPCGPTACTGMPGGAGLVAIKTTKDPKSVGIVMDWLASSPVYKEFIERTLFLPANKEVIAEGLDYKTDDAQVKAALNAFVKASSSTAPEAYQMQGWTWNNAVWGIWVSRLGQAMAGELSTDDAFKRIDEDVAQKVSEAGGK